MHAFRRFRFLNCSLAMLALGVLAAGRSAAQDEPKPEVAATRQVTIYYQGLSPRGDFAFKWKDARDSRPVGLLNWSVPSELVGTGNMGRDFHTYCAQTLVGVTAGETYRYEIVDPALPKNYELKDDEAGQKEALYRTAFIRELFGRFYLDSIDPNKPDEARAFQIALWEIINEAELPPAKDLPSTPTPFSLTKGSFQADYPVFDQAPVYVQRAQAMLQPLTGDESQFYGNAGLAGYRLVRMNGLGSVTNPNELVQAQLALQKVEGGVGGNAGVGGGSGGVGGAGFGGAPLAGGGGTGGGLGGIGGGAGGGGIFGGTGNGNNNNGTPPNGTNVPPGGGGDPPGGTTVIPPVNQPPDVVDDPPTTPPTENTNPVPAPPAILLGLVGIGALGGYRALRRRVMKTA